MKFPIILFILLIISSLSLFAQEEKFIDAPPPDSVRHEIIYHSSLTGSWSSGNINRDFLDVKVSTEYAREKIALHATPEFIFGKINNNLFEREYSLISDIKILPKNQFFGFGFAHWEQSFLRKIHYRRQYGIGLAWQGIKNERVEFALTNAFIFEKTEFMDDTQGIETLRTSVRAKGKYDLWENRLHLRHVIFLQPSLLTNNVRWRTDIELFVPISSHINFSLRWKHSYESLVAQARKRHDDRWAVGLTFTNE